MTAKDMVDEVERETTRYYYVDGVVEMAIGLFFIVISLLLLGWVLLDVRSWQGMLAIVALVGVTVFGAAGVKRAVGLVKERVTYERTGYVAYEHGEPQVSRWPVILAGLVLILLLLVLPDALNRMALAIGTLLGVLLAYMGYRVSVTRFYAVGLLSFLAGLAATLLVGDEMVGATLTFASSGIALLLSGVIVFSNYLQQHPARGDE